MRLLEPLPLQPAAEVGKKFTLDSKEPKGGYQEFLLNEARYASLSRVLPQEQVDELFRENEEAAMARYEHLTKLKDLYARLNKCRRASKNTVRVLRRLSVKHAHFFGDSMCP